MSTQGNTPILSPFGRRLISTLTFMTGAIFLALALAGCKSSASQIELQSGDYGRSDFILTLQDGSYSIRGGGRMMQLERGSYTTEKNKITFTVEEYAIEAKAVCGTFPATFSYNYTFDVKTQELILKEIDDQCSTRRFDLTYKPLTYTKGERSETQSNLIK